MGVVSSMLVFYVVCWALVVVGEKFYVRCEWFRECGHLSQALASQVIPSWIRQNFLSLYALAFFFGLYVHLLVLGARMIRVR